MHHTLVTWHMPNLCGVLAVCTAHALYHANTLCQIFKSCVLAACILLHFLANHTAPLTALVALLDLGNQNQHQLIHNMQVRVRS
jgi:hypothetical protein